MRSLTFPGKQIEVSAGQPQFLLMSPCAAAGVAVGGLSFQPKCNLASLGQHWGLHSLITATVMKCWQLISRDSVGLLDTPSALLRTWMLLISFSMQPDYVIFSLPFSISQLLPS